MEERDDLCRVCARNCDADRNRVNGFCGMSNLPMVARAFLHKWEEPCISGKYGSGTVFFSGCNLKCVYCQNYLISQENFGKVISIDQLQRIYLTLQDKGAHNINLVNPTHFTPQIRESLLNVNVINIPIIYNSNAYESQKGLNLMEGIVDVFLPDIKYYNAEVSKKYSNASNYFEVATKSIIEMFRQVGATALDNDGIIKRGLIIRHLILPGLASESIKILDWIDANLPKSVYVSLMSQYTPFYRAKDYPEINRRITRYEYEKVLNHFYKRGFENGYVQERDSASEEYIPDFNLEGLE